LCAVRPLEDPLDDPLEDPLLDPLLDDPLEDPPDLLELPEDRESDVPAREPVDDSPADELSGRVRVYPWPFTILPCGTSSFSFRRPEMLTGES
jgi:hypothetical protein